MEYSQIAKDFFKAGIDKMILQDFESAIIHLTMAIEFAPDYGVAYLYRAICKMQICDDKGCVDDCDKAISIYPAYAPAYHNRGIAKIALKDEAGAWIDILTAQKLGYSLANELVEKYFK